MSARVVKHYLLDLPFQFLGLKTITSKNLNGENYLSRYAFVEL